MVATRSSTTTPTKSQQRQQGGNGTSSCSNTTTTTTSTPQQQRTLHTPVPRSRLNSKDITSTPTYIDYATSTAMSNMQHQTNDLTTNTVTQPSLHMDSPISRSNGNNNSSNTTTSHRPRFNSRDIPRSYSGQYSTETNNLLPLECLRTQQIVAQNVSLGVFLSTYLTFILFLQLLSASIISTAATTTARITNNHLASSSSSVWMNSLYLVLSSSWTITNAMHCVVTLMYLHWMKGSYLLDEQGELNAMTVWEQLEATNESATHMRRIFLIVPTGLTYMACLSCKFQPITCTINIILWSISMFAKLPQMNGVRLFGINRTVGIDDDFTNSDCNNNSPSIPES